MKKDEKNVKSSQGISISLFPSDAAFQDAAFNRGRRLLEGGVYQRAVFFPNGWLKVWRSIEGGVYQRAAFIRGNTVNANKCS